MSIKTLDSAHIGRRKIRLNKVKRPSVTCFFIHSAAKKCKDNLKMTVTSIKGAWISGLGGRVEVNLSDGKSANIWFEAPV